LSSDSDLQLFGHDFAFLQDFFDFFEWQLFGTEKAFAFSHFLQSEGFISAGAGVGTVFLGMFLFPLPSNAMLSKGSSF